MTTATGYTLWCDHPRCTMFVRGTSRTEVRGSAAKRGWQIDADKVDDDHCPAHKTGNYSEEG